MLKVINLLKIYKTKGKLEDVEALKNLNFEIQNGETIAIVGTSGSGKSTLLQILGCLDKPTNGEILFENRDLAKFSDLELAGFRNKSIGFVFQAFYLQNYLTVAENIAVPLMFAKQKLSQAEIDKQVEYLLQRVGLTKQKDYLPNQLSGGQQQRVAIARALVNNPDIILADEPTGNLDKKTSQEILNLLLELNSQGTTLIMVTHDDKVASQMKRIIHLEDGEIV